MTLPYFQDEELSVLVLTSGRLTLVSPGVVALSSPGGVINWKDQQAPGQNGMISVRGPDPISEFDATFFLSGDRVDPEGRDEFDRWDEFQRMIDSTTAGPKPFAVTVFHPDLARLNIVDVVKKSVGLMQHDGKGGASIKVSFRVHKPPKPQPSAKVEPGSPTPTPADPLAAAKAERDRLLAEAEQP